MENHQEHAKPINVSKLPITVRVAGFKLLFSYVKV